MPVEYWRADDEVDEIAKELIEKHHQDLLEEDVVFLMRSKAAKSDGRAVLGTASKLSEKQRTLMGSDALFVIEIAADEWKSLGKLQRIALVDHELCHCTVEETEKDGYVERKAKIRQHDLEEFYDIVRRYGAWKDDIKEIGEQLKLFEIESVGGNVVELKKVM